ncbi:MarR family winged helix-turn-helix transcriptional regulator [Streptosporangium lutulentum]
MSDLSHAEAVAEEIRTAIGRVVRRLRQESGMPNHQVTALWWLERHGPMTASGLAVTERITPQSMAVTLAALYDQGFVDRTPDPHDRGRSCGRSPRVAARSSSRIGLGGLGGWSPRSMRNSPARRRPGYGTRQGC